MKLEQAVKFFGTQREIAQRLGLTEAAVSVWKARGGVIPIKHALKLGRITAGRLNISMKDYE